MSFPHAKLLCFLACCYRVFWLLDVTNRQTRRQTQSIPSRWQYPETAGILEALWTHIGNETEGAANHPLLRDTARDVIQSLDETVRPFARHELDVEVFVGVGDMVVQGQREAEDAAAAELFRVLRAVASALQYTASKEAKLATSIEQNGGDVSALPDTMTNSDKSDEKPSLADLLCETVNDLLAEQKQQRYLICCFYSRQV